MKLKVFEVFEAAGFVSDYGNATVDVGVAKSVESKRRDATAGSGLHDTRLSVNEASSMLSRG